MAGPPLPPPPPPSPALLAADRGGFQLIRNYVYVARTNPRTQPCGNLLASTITRRGEKSPRVSLSFSFLLRPLLARSRIFIASAGEQETRSRARQVGRKADGWTDRQASVGARGSSRQKFATSRVPNNYARRIAPACYAAILPV